MPDTRPGALSRRTMLGAAGAAAAGAALWTGSGASADPGDTVTPQGRHDELDPARPKEQFRAVWIAGVVNIDWPSTTGLDAATQQAEYLRWLDDAKHYRFNAVITQIRPTADAYWPSSHEPWSRWLTGEQGGDPGYDPLAFAVEATHAAGMEFHAWFNPYRVSMPASSGDAGTDPSKLHESHPARQNPDWVVPYPKVGAAGRLYYNPGIPEVRAHVIDAMMDAVDRYDIDAVHFDDYFYPYPAGGEDFDDDAAFAEYGGDFTDKADWRRYNTDQLILEFGRRVKESKPWVRFGVSPFGVWRNIADDPEGSDTRAGAPTYDVLYADTRKWVREGWIDYILPQIYWAMSLPAASYRVLAEWWNDACENTDCQLYLGEATYKVNVDTVSPEWKQDPRELLNHLTLCREHANIVGNAYFSGNPVRQDQLSAMTLLRDEHYSRPALVPASSHLGGRTPKAPKVSSVEWRDGAYTVEWRPHRRGEGIDEIVRYAVYTTVGHPDECDLADATNLVAVVPHDPGAEVQSFRWEGGFESGRRFAVTALNRVWTEGRAGVRKTRKN
ncbi:uncharacterized lipoprotein YddW (UPF0748 family) [Stackebrandtia albiflava]|uniref:Uncharacterized lipoprotein YddW (UPF0748 family) n=1 Tax=Stackebrandtia albiflava TaxID=406432 RepID=A0A562V1Y8_9ACTN|nr:family 10 glycosylhydrolase [Stackebrandtia albiflava]TWJ11916.1 uncharacterized lipoprotein YddW (UPF0748 family) [Stackebrandtia albiflava]